MSVKLKNKPNRRGADLPCKHCGKVFKLEYTTLRRARKRGYYQCFECSITNPEYKEKQREGFLKVLGTEEYSKALSDARKKYFAEHGTGDCRKGALKLWHDPICAESANVLKGKIKDRMNDPQYQAEESLRRSTPEFKAKMSVSITAAFQNPEVRARHMVAMESDQTKQRLSESNKEVWRRESHKVKMHGISLDRWQNPEYWAKLATIRQNMPVISSLNKTIFAILDSLNIVWVSEHPIGPYNFDIFIPSHNLLIECNGEYWHSLPKAIRTDRGKATYIERYFPELRLITIWELEFHIPGKIESTVRKLLGMDRDAVESPDFKKLTIRLVDSKDAAIIYRNHYLGTVRGKHHFGLEYGGEIIGACSFGSFQRNEQTLRYGRDALELTRFFLAPKYQVKNLGSWFLSRCLKLIDRMVVTYADTTFGHDGALYKACNFVFDHEVAPDYCYMSTDNWIIHKRTVWGRASKMGVSEKQYATDNGLKRKWGGIKRCFVYRGKRKVGIEV